MSEPIDISSNLRETAAHTDFVELASRIVDDLAKILRSEIKLFDASLRKTLESQTDRILGSVFLLIALIYGSLCLIGGVILLLHTWLEWWMALGRRLSSTIWQAPFAHLVTCWIDDFATR